MGSDLISLREKMDEIGHWEGLFHQAVGCYQDALGVIETGVLGRCPSDLFEDEVTLQPDREALAGVKSAERLAGCHTEVCAKLQVTGARVQVLATGTAELREALRLMAASIGRLRQREGKQEDRFRSLAEEINYAAQLEDPEALRCTVRKQVLRLVAAVDDMQREGEVALAEMQQEVDSFRDRLEIAKSAAMLDPLTGIPNRRAIEMRVSQWIATGRVFSLVVLDLDGFKSINDSCGHGAGDEVLSILAARLKMQLRATDMAGRWGGDEFVAVLDCSLRDALNRARTIQDRLSGVYTLNRGRHNQRVRVCLSLGVAEHRPNESLEQLFDRADEMLYQNKGAR
jgi:diguanylate cyclase (GGDEF)-like protein